MTENKVAVTKKHASVTPYWNSVAAAAITTVSLYIYVCIYALQLASLLADLRLETRYSNIAQWIAHSCFWNRKVKCQGHDRKYTSRAIK